jgi:hypothetical protein
VNELEKEKIIAKVEHQSIWWDREKNYDNPPPLWVSEIEIEADSSGYYYLKPTHKKDNGKFIANARWSWKEIHVVEFKNYLTGNLVHNHKVQLSFFSVSSNHVRSATPFLVLEMDKSMMEKWREQDYWFRNDVHYLVRENGKKFYGGQDKNGEGKRCIICRNLQRADATECDKGC